MTVNIPPPVISCEIPDYPELADVQSMKQCEGSAIYCFDRANMLKLLSNTLKRKAWRVEVEARCGVHIDVDTTSEPSVTIEEPTKEND